MDVKDENEIKEGGEDTIITSTYHFKLGRHEEPDLATTGHYWEIVEFNKIGQVQQLV